MKSYLKKIILQFAVILAFFSIVEIALYSIEYFFSNNLFKNQTTFLIDSSKDYTHIKNFDRTNFCDPIHVNEKGHRLVAKCLTDFLTKSIDLSSEKKIFALGGSTTEGRDCNSNVRWSDLLEKNLKNIRIINLGKAAQSTSYDLEILRKNLESGNIPDYVLWGNWVNELFAANTEINSFNFQFVFLKFYNTLYKHLRSARLISNYYNELQAHSFSLIDAANIFNDENEKFIAFSNSGVNTKNELYKKSLDHYADNTKLLADLSKKYKFSVIIQGFPYIIKFYSHVHPRLDIFFENWVLAIKNQQHYEADKYHFKYVDVHSCFEKMRGAAKYK